jgi:hypothetical protein
LENQPGIEAVGFSNRLPLEGELWVSTIAPEGAVLREEDQPVANYRFVSEGYWGALGIRLLEGRYLEPADRELHHLVLSAAAAERLFPGESAVGKRVIGYNDDLPILEIVGVVDDVKTGALGETAVPLNDRTDR